MDNAAGELAIIDAQVHYGPWKPDGSVTDMYPGADLIARASAAGIRKVVQVIGTRDGWNLEPSLQAYAEHSGGILGVVGRFDPFAPDLERRLRDYAGTPGILGIRITSKKPDGETWLRERTLDPLFAAAEKLDVAIQLFCPYQAEESLDAARRFPGVRFLIDHMGMRHEPGASEAEIFRQWPQLIRLGEEPNVWIKCSYFPQAMHEIERFPFPKSQLWLRRLYERLGAEKLIWGSNFPPVEKICSYPEAVDFVRVHCDYFSDADRAAIMGDNFLRHFSPERAPRPLSAAAGL